MNRAPAYQVYAAEYLADEEIQLWSLEEEGAFNHLKNRCWVSGSLPADLGMLSRLCKGASTTLLSVVVKRFQPHPDDATRLILPEHEAQMAKHAEWRAKSSEGGKKSAEARAKAKGGPTVVQAPNEGCSNISSSFSNCKLHIEDKEQNTLALTPSGVHAPASVISLPLNDGSLFSVTERHVAEWEELYQSIDVRQELRNYRGHFDAKPKERKTKTGILASVNHWLRNAQDKAKGNVNGTHRTGPSASRNQDRTDSLKGNAAGAYGDVLSRITPSRAIGTTGSLS